MSGMDCHHVPISPANIARPKSFTMPLDTMNEQLSPANNSSELRRPSRYHTTKPHTIPRGRPLKKIATTFLKSGEKGVCVVKVPL